MARTRTLRSKKMYYINLPCEMRKENERTHKKINLRFSKAQLRIVFDKVYNERKEK